MDVSGSVIIVSYNSGASLPQCLASIARQGSRVHVVVVDNASADNSAEIAATAGVDIELMQNRANVGFARGVNAGLAKTSGDFVLVLNPDCRLNDGALEVLMAALGAHPECAIVGPRVLNEDGSVQGSARGDPTLMTGLFGRTTLLTRLLPQSPWSRRNVRIHPSGLDEDAAFDVDWVSGACMLVRRDALMAVGGFDERYFLYWEDADLCRRLRQRGHTIRYVPAAAVIHIGGESSRSAKSLATRAFHKSAYIYYASHVARGPLRRAFARLVLVLRCQWKLMTLRSDG